MHEKVVEKMGSCERGGGERGIWGMKITKFHHINI